MSSLSVSGSFCARWRYLAVTCSEQHVRVKAGKNEVVRRLECCKAHIRQHVCVLSHDGRTSLGVMASRGVGTCRRVGLHCWPNKDARRTARRARAACVREVFFGTNNTWRTCRSGGSVVYRSVLSGAGNGGADVDAPKFADPALGLCGWMRVVVVEVGG